MPAKNLLILGGGMFAVSIVLNFIVAYSAYGKVDECLDKSAGCALSTEQVAGKIAMTLAIIGIGILAVSIVLLLVESAKKKKQ